MTKIFLTQGKVALVDDDNVERISNFKWFAVNDKKNGMWYARTVAKLNSGKYRPIPMHRILYQVSSKMVVDHKDRDGLNNQRSNIRICTRQQNRWNSKKQARTKNRYKGVSTRYQRDKKRICGYVSEIEVNRKRIKIGWYKTEKEAALAYNKAAKKYFGEFALLNNI